MKKIVLLILLVFSFNNKNYAQENWKTEPMDVTETDPRIGTLENKTFGIVTNSYKRLIIDTNGVVKINKLIGRGVRLVFADSLGNLVVDNDGGISGNDNPSTISICGNPANELDWNPLRCASKPCLDNMIPWYEGGNQIMPLGNNTIGTCSNHDFVLKASSNNRLWIKTTGKIGIDESNPTAKFEVNEPNLLPAGSGNYHLLTSFKANVNNSFAHNTWVLRDHVGTNDWQDTRLHDGISVDISFIVPGTDTRTWWERRAHADEQSWGTGSTTYMRLKPNQLQVSEQPNAPNTSALCVNVNTTDAFEVYDESTQKINFKVKSNGHVFAREIRVLAPNLNFPDYVFEKGYQLKSLFEVENFINENKHLPNIPSAIEVTESGINLAELQVKQMEKIEELYLYVIQQQKEIEKLKEQNSKLEKLIKTN